MKLDLELTSEATGQKRFIRIRKTYGTRCMHHAVIWGHDGYFYRFDMPYGKGISESIIDEAKSIANRF